MSCVPLPSPQMLLFFLFKLVALCSVVLPVLAQGHYNQDYGGSPGPGGYYPPSDYSEKPNVCKTAAL